MTKPQDKPASRSQRAGPQDASAQASAASKKPQDQQQQTGQRKGPHDQQGAKGARRMGGESAAHDAARSADDQGSNRTGLARPAGGTPNTAKQ